MEDDLVIETLTRTALQLAHPKFGRNFEAGLAMLECVEQRCAAPDSNEALRLAGYRGIILLWQDRPFVAAVTLQHAAERAGELGYYGLRNWLYTQFIIANTYLKRVQANVSTV